jgi:hypothetical protein
MHTDQQVYMNPVGFRDGVYKIILNELDLDSAMILHLRPTKIKANLADEAVRN